MCGIAGVIGHKEAANLTYLCLYALQHRGQESAGIVSADNGNHYQYRRMGLVSDVFTDKVLKKLPGDRAIGHVRYSTSGETVLENAQPFLVNASWGYLALSHNGNLTNGIKLRHNLEDEGAIFQSTMDSEVIAHLTARSRKRTIETRIIDALSQVEGAYAMLFLMPGMMVAARDPFGFRPLVLGELDGAYVVASETCAFDLIGAKLIRSVEPGEVLIFKDGKFESRFPFQKPRKKAHCIFEYIYFSRPDSHVFDRDVYPIREGFGKVLAHEHAVSADVVIPVPDSGVPAALGYSKESGIPFEMGFIRNHYVGRTFIEPKESIRHFGVRIKLNPVKETLRGKRVIVVDDSIVRGTTSKKIVDLVKKPVLKRFMLGFRVLQLVGLVFTE